MSEEIIENEIEFLIERIAYLNYIQQNILKKFLNHSYLEEDKIEWCKIGIFSSKEIANSLDKLQIQMNHFHEKNENKNE